MKKTFQTLLFSTAGVVAMFVLLAAVNFIAGHFKGRVDLTEDREFTLSKGTRAILSRLDTPVQVRLYFSRSNSETPVFLKTYEQRVEDLLNEYRQASKGLIEIKKLDPEPDSDAEDSAKLDGIEGQPLPTGEKVYLGVSVSMLDQKQAIPFLSPDRERLLEYDLSRAISSVMTTEKPVVGIMSPLPVLGEGNPMMMQMGRGQEPWILATELQRDFTVRQVEMTADKIPDDVKVLMVIHPKNISETAQYAIDQFVLRGGKLIAFLDPLAALDRQQNPMMNFAPPSGSSLDKLLKAWGINFDSTKVVADMNYIGTTRQGRNPTLLLLDENAVNKDDVVTSDIDNLFMVFAGAFSGTATEGLKETVLVKSSKDSQLVEPMMAQMSGEELVKNFVRSGTEYPLAVRLTGKFKTAFPEGKPAAANEKPNDKKSETKPEPALKESAQENTVILIGDSDFIQDPVAANTVQNPFGGGRMVMPANGNLGFAQNVVEQLSGDNDLIAMRSRASRERPFTLIKQMQTKAEANYRDRIKSLEESLADTERKLNELQKNKDSGQKFILSPEQQKELEEFRKKEAQAKTDLKQMRKNLRADIDSLETRTKWKDIAVMPLLVTLAGIGMAIIKRKHAAAK